MIPQSGTIKKLTTFVPKPDVEAVKKALFETGGGAIGNYENCSFSSEGVGTFKGNQASNPVIGKPHEFKQLRERKIEILFAKHLESKILKTLFKTHPYEEVAYEISTLENKNQFIGWSAMRDILLQSLIPAPSPTLMTTDWVANHYKWIVWKCASMARKFPSQCGGIDGWFTPQRVLKQLEHRWRREHDNGERSCLKKM